MWIFDLAETTNNPINDEVYFPVKKPPHKDHLRKKTNLLINTNPQIKTDLHMMTRHPVAQDRLN